MKNNQCSRSLLYCLLFVGLVGAQVREAWGLNEDFQVTITVEGAVNTVGNPLVFGMDSDAIDGLDYGDVKDELSPPNGPGIMNYIAFTGPASAYSGFNLLTDIRESLESEQGTKIWNLSAWHDGSDTDIVLTWGDHTGLKNSGATVELSGGNINTPIDLTDAGSFTIAANDGGTYYVTYGDAPQDQKGSLAVVTDSEKAFWRLMDAAGTGDAFDSGNVNVSTDGDGNPIWRNASETVRIDDLPFDTYTVIFQDIDVSYVTPESRQVSINNIELTEVEETYERVSAGVVVTPFAITTTEKGGSAKISVSLDAEPTHDVTVTATLGGDSPDAADLGDTTELTFTADSRGDWDQTKNFTVTGVDDDITNNDGGRAYTVTLTFASDDDRYHEYDVDPVPGVTVDDDGADIVVDPMVGLVTNEDTTAGNYTATFDLSLNSTPSGTVTAVIESSNQAEGVVSAVDDEDTVAETVTLSFTAADVVKTVTITGQDDTTYDGDVRYQIALAFTSTDTDDFYHGQHRRVGVTNLDDELPPSPDADLLFLPEAALDFGEVYEGIEKTKVVTIVNTGEAMTLTVTTSNDAFTVKGAGTSYAASDTVVVPEGTTDTPESAALKVKYTAGTAGDSDTGTLTFTNGGRAVVYALSLSGSVIAPLDGGVLRVKQPVIVVKGTDTADVSFDIELNTEDPNGDGDPSDGVAYHFFMFEMSLPGIVSNVVVSTNTSRTEGKSFSQSELPSGVIELSWVDLGAVKSISAEDGTLLTVTATVDVSGGEATYPIYLSNVRNAAGDDEYEVAREGADLVVSEHVVLAHLDVNGTGTVTFHDVVYIYRYVAMDKRADSGLRPSAFYQLGDGVTIEDVEQNIVDLADNGLDVNGTGTVTFHDVVYIYRYVAMDKRADSGLRPSAFYQLGDGVTIEDVQANIENIFP